MGAKIATATTVKLLRNTGNWDGDARLYRLDPPIKYKEYDWDNDDNEVVTEHVAEYVVVSAVHNAFAHETYIFPADRKGNIEKWGELEGSQRGTTSHAKVLANAGYKVVS